MIKEDLGLSLSLSLPAPVEMNRPDPFLQLNLSTPISSWNTHTTFASDHDGSSGDAGSLFKQQQQKQGLIDMNHSPAANDVLYLCEHEVEDEEPVASSANSTVSCVMSGSGIFKRSSDRSAEDQEQQDIADHDQRASSSSRGNIISDEEDLDGDRDGSRKKLRLSKDQSATLEESFKEHNTLNPKQKQALAKRLGLRPRQVEVWFQNRRARTKLKQTEVDCDFLKRCCENLREDNRRLQKEVQELRAFKLLTVTPPHHDFYMHMPPPTTLTLCPSCELRLPAPLPAATPSSPGRPFIPFHHHHPWAAVLPQPRHFDVLRPQS